MNQFSLQEYVAVIRHASHERWLKHWAANQKHPDSVKICPNTSQCSEIVKAGKLLTKS